MTLTDSAFSRDGEGESSALPLQKNLSKKKESLRLSEDALLQNQIGNLVGIAGTVMDIAENRRTKTEKENLKDTLASRYANALIESSSDFISIFTLEGQCIFINQAGQELIGLEGREEFQRVFISEYIMPEDLTELREKILPVVREKGHWEGELSFTHLKTYQPIPIYSNIFTIKDHNTHQAIALAIVSHDITKRKRVEEELRKSEARFRELAQREALLNRLSGQIRRSLDLNTILQTAVQEIRNLLQVDRCLFLWYRPDSNHPIWEVIQEARTSVFPSLIGHRIPVTKLAPLTARVFDKQITRVDNARSLTDPTEQRFFFSMGYTALLELPIYTQSGEIGVVSCGHSSGARPWRNSEVELLQAVADQIAIAIDQAELYKQSRIAAITAQEQATKLEHTLQELKQAQAQLVQSEKMSSLGQLVGGIAHEINNPVSFIYGNLTYVKEYAEGLLNLVQLYQEYYPNSVPKIKASEEEIEINFIKEDLPKILSSMKIGVDRIRQIVFSLRNFSRLDEAEMKWVDVHEGIDNTLLILDHRLKAKQPNCPDIQVVKDYSNLPKVQCYPGQLNQVFMNILTNAIEAIDDYNKMRSFEDIKSNPSTIWICTDVVESKDVMILIGDNGAGMTPEVNRRLFDPFFTTKPVGSGTGLGMSISYKIIVEQHGGQLQCISAPGQGAVFLIQIPIQQKMFS
ncbi:MAG: ATP-binding protein [Potamolinea sp.]